MTTTSYPAAGNNGLSSAQWATLYGDQDGIVEDYMASGIPACRLDRINAGDLARIQPGKVKVNGYLLEVTAAEDLYVAPVTVGQPSKTYSILAQYDPALNVPDGSGNAATAGPCRLIATDNPPTAGGQKYTLLYQITRTASQNLDAAAVVDFRRWIGPVVSWPLTPATAPLGVNFPRGTIAIQTDSAISQGWDFSIYTINAAGTGLAWKETSRLPGVPFPAVSALVAYDRPAELYAYAGRMIGLRGTLKKSSGNPLSTTGGQVLLGTLPSWARPSAAGYLRFSVFGFGSGYHRSALVKVENGGDVYMYDPPETITAIALDGVHFQAGA